MPDEETTAPEEGQPADGAEEAAAPTGARPARADDPERAARIEAAKAKAAEARAEREAAGGAKPATGREVVTASRIPASKERDGGGLVAAGADGHAIVIARPAPVGPALPQISRRSVLRIGFWTALGATLVGIATTTLISVYPRSVTRLAGQHVVGNLKDLAPGTKKELSIQVPDKQRPLEALEAKVYLVRLNAEQAAKNAPATEGSVLALYRKCPHLGCTVPYRPEFTFEDPRIGQSYSGWFRCPCHGSTYSDAGVRVFGPAPRSMDSFALAIGDDGTLTVDVGKLNTGTTDNGKYALPPPAGLA